jgi:hypothetical protein
MRSKRELLRVVVNQAGAIAIDPTGKKPGRGAYVCRSRTCLEQAVRGHRLDKGLKTQVSQDVVRSLVAEMEAMPPDETGKPDAAGGD